MYSIQDVFARKTLWLWVLLLCLLLVMVCGFRLTMPVSAQEICSGSLPPRLVIGGEGRVLPGYPNNVRRDPTKGASKVGQMRSGRSFAILDGPVCADGYTWWKIDADGLVGWTVEGGSGEYWLELTTIPPTATPLYTATPAPTLSNCYVTVSVALNNVVVKDHVGVNAFDSTSIVGGDEAYLWYGVSSAPRSQQEYDVGANDEWYLLESFDLYDGSRVFGLPTLRRPSHCEYKTIVFFALSEDDGLLGSRDLGILEVNIDSNNLDRYPLTETRSITGTILEGTYDYEYTYTIDVQQGRGAGVSSNVVKRGTIQVDRSNERRFASNAYPFTPLADLLRQEKYNQVLNGSCNLEYDVAYVIVDTSSLITCSFYGYKGQRMTLEALADGAVLMSGSDNMVSVEGVYELPSDGYYGVRIILRENKGSYIGVIRLLRQYAP